MANNGPICSLKTCKKEIQQMDGHSDVRAFNITEREQKNLNLYAEWTEDGRASFHRRCWIKLHRAAKGKNSSTASDPIKLCDVERKLLTEAAKTVEHHDSEENIIIEANRICDMMKKSKHCIAFTGAGISTAAGIGDFRGIDGKWTDNDKTKDYGSKGTAKPRKGRGTYRSIRPTYTHEAIVKLMDMGIIKYLISQNCDGLHQLSGVRPDLISELHGNTYEERCENCPARYHRSYPVGGAAMNVPANICPNCRHNHRTGRRCKTKGCDGYLMNTIINFSDHLESRVLGNATNNASQADMCIALGSTLMVSPANDLVTMGKKPTQLVICNRQSTPYDHISYEVNPDTATQCGSRVFADCDRLMRMVMKQMLQPAELKEWEGGRPERLVTYDLNREM